MEASETENTESPAPRKKRQPNEYVVLELDREEGVYQDVGKVIAINARDAIKLGFARLQEQERGAGPFELIAIPARSFQIRTVSGQVRQQVSVTVV
jgi:hypothetical protein